MRRNLVLITLAAVVLASGASFAANRGVSTVELGASPAGAFIPNWMTSDGSFISGNGRPFGYYPFSLVDGVWVDDVPLVPNIPSRDGRFMAGQDAVMSSPREGAIRDVSTGTLTYISIPGGIACGTNATSPFGISGNGSYVTGLGYLNGCGRGNFGAFLFDGTTTTYLGSPIDGGRGDAVADDGTVVGWGYFPNSANWRGAIYAGGAWSWIDGMGDDIRLTPDEEFFKGQAFDITPDGNYVFGIHYGASGFSDPGAWGSAYIWDRTAGTYTKMSDPNRETNFVQAMGISDDGSAAIGRSGSFFSNYPVLWTKETGSLDVHLFLLGQGLDDLYFWRIQGGGDVNHDGSMIAIGGYNLTTAKSEGMLVSLTKAKICHKPDGNARTLTVNWDSLGDHLGHGDDLATCEFMSSDARSRLADLRPADPHATEGSEMSNGFIAPIVDNADQAGTCNTVDDASTAVETPVLEEQRTRRELTRFRR